MAASRKHSAMRPAGHLLVDDRVVADTLQCVHCATHWQVVQGSGRRRGWCLKCSGPTCGQPGCEDCLPAERRLEIIEQQQRGGVPLKS